MVANPVLSLALACMLCLGSNQTLTRNTTLQRMPSVLVLLLLLLLLLLLSLLRLLPLFRPAVGFPRLGGVCMYGELNCSNVKMSLRDQERPPSCLGIASECGCRAGERRDAAAHARYRTGVVCPSRADEGGSINQLTTHTSSYNSVAVGRPTQAFMVAGAVGGDPGGSLSSWGVV